MSTEEKKYELHPDERETTLTFCHGGRYAMFYTNSKKERNTFKKRLGNAPDVVIHIDNDLVLSATVPAKYVRTVSHSFKLYKGDKDVCSSDDTGDNTETVEEEDSGSSISSGDPSEEQEDLQDSGSEES